MKALFASIFVALLALSAVAWQIAPEPVEHGKLRLTWVSDDNPMRRAQIEPFNALHPDLKLTLDPTNADMAKVIVQSIGGVGPDLFDCYDAFQLNAFVKAGIAWDVTDELKQLGVDVPAECWPATLPNATVDGRVYGHPTNAAVNGLWFHRDVFDAAGVPHPKGPMTWDQFVRMAEKLKVVDARGRVRQYALLNDWDQNFLQFVRQWGGRMYSDDGTRCTLDSPEAVAAVRFMHDLIYKYELAPSPVAEQTMATTGGWGQGVITLFRAKQAATALGGRWWLCNLRSDAALDLGAAEAPHGTHRVFRGYGKATLINRNSPRRAEALKFLVHLHTQPYNELINAQADGVGPVMKYADSDTFLHNPEYPREDYNDVWREMQRLAVPDQVSPFVNGPTLIRLIKTQLDLMKMNAKPVEAGMRDLARQVNDHIADQVRRDPELRAEFDRRVGAAAVATTGGGA